MTVAGTAIVAAGHEVHVGESGTGTLVVNGGQFSSAAQMIVGNANGASGAVAQNGGALDINGGAPLFSATKEGASAATRSPTARSTPAAASSSARTARPRSRKPAAATTSHST